MSVSVAAPRIAIGDLDDEWASTLTHGVGFAASLPALVFLVASAADSARLLGCAVFGGAMALVYLASMLYHSARCSRRKHLLRIFDHSAIYLLIAGTYTPFLLVHLRSELIAWVVLAAIWGLALFGVVAKVFFFQWAQRFSTALYLVMGWLVVLAVQPALALLPAGALAWIVAGGVAYTLGVVFYVWEQLPYNHSVWHLFVMAGSFSHYLAVLYYVAPPSA